MPLTLTNEIGKRGLALIQAFEEFRAKAYLPTPDDVWTIGWGHTEGVKEGDTCTLADADRWLRADCHNAERAVNWRVRVALTQNEFDALVSLAFNIGGDAFARSTLLKRLNEGEKAAAAEQFLVWNKQKGKVLNGLVRRRAKERELFLLQE